MSVLLYLVSAVVMYCIIKSAVKAAIIEANAEMRANENSGSDAVQNSGIAKVKCSRCGVEHEIDDPKCPHCGAVLSE